MQTLYENENLKIEIETSEIPWFKIFTKQHYKEMSEVPKALRDDIYDMLDLVEREMLRYYKPKKINIASFGNYLPQVHWHIMARFEEDSYYPESMWGIQQRENTLTLPSFDIFCQQLTLKIITLFNRNTF